MKEAGLNITEEFRVEIYDGEHWLGRLYLDILIEEVVVVEIKAFPHLLTNAETAQVICYLAATGQKVGLLINFGRQHLEYKRILPPRHLDGGQERIQHFLWRPKEQSPVPSKEKSTRS